jgi:hypothetical protein
MDRYTRLLTDDLYVDVAIDRSKTSTSDKMDWLKEADLIRDKLRNSLVIRYPSELSISFEVRHCYIGSYISRKLQTRGSH